MNKRNWMVASTLAAAVLMLNAPLSAQANSLLEAASSAGDVSGDTSYPVIEVTGLDAHKDKRVSLFFVSGYEGSITLQGRSIKARSIKQFYTQNPDELESILSAVVDANGVARFPAVTVARSGLDIANYLVMVVQSQELPAAFLLNPDGSAPSDPRGRPQDALSRRADLRAFLGLDQLEALKANSAKIVLPLSQMIR